MVETLVKNSLFMKTISLPLTMIIVATLISVVVKTYEDDPFQSSTKTVFTAIVRSIQFNLFVISLMECTLIINDDYGIPCASLFGLMSYILFCTIDQNRQFSSRFRVKTGEG